ncbi:MAG: DUF2177 family protein [Gemmatimonadetes bacterium]|nr:DUF2177 family protein [Gemmatimonadota bacterium]NNL30595.1 DUF2177 family protein [Gemmatimonadota bacterium]
MKYLALYGLTALGFFAIDFVWLSRIAVSFYDKHLGHLLREEPVIWAAVAFYSLYLVGVVVFAVLPGLEAGSMARSVALGALFGLVAYATFDLTCKALFEDFPNIVVVVDLAWGTVLTGTTATLGYLAGRWLGLG